MSLTRQLKIPAFDQFRIVPQPSQASTCLGERKCADPIRAGSGSRLPVVPETKQTNLDCVAVASSNTEADMTFADCARCLSICRSLAEYIIHAVKDKHSAALYLIFVKRHVNNMHHILSCLVLHLGK